NFERASRDKLKGNLTDAILSSTKCLGKKRWQQIPDRTKNAIATILVEEDQEADARRRLTTECKLNGEEAEKALKVHLPEGYLHFSLLAIEKLLPHLEKGLMLMGNDESDSALHAAGYLRPDQREINQQEMLPAPPDLPNPIVRQALHEVRKVVNNVIRKYGKPASIHVELAREAKKSFDERKEIRFENAKRRKEREKAAEQIEARGFVPRRSSINAYLLWEEQQKTCPYCGKKISQSQLFNDGETDVDHILPRWRSLDDSMANKVVCHRACNEKKGDRTPREFLQVSQPEKYEQMLSAMMVLPYNKRKKFLQEETVLKDFIERQLRDTAYISRCVSQYLRCLGVEIVCPRGQMTSELRHRWGLNNILDPLQQGRKNRFDHRHRLFLAVAPWAAPSYRCEAAPRNSSSTSGSG
ncbi:MAG: type II CRISPR RNA-guided endonuclease Cas9, partial [Planctomycetes bacterium]|nr:type II CRISPR RNA-guided endonuclease Cas9 [Planctomycetota bacterium]